MATAVTMPKLGLTMQGGTVVAWLKQVGETVQMGEEVCEISTDKITNTVVAPVAGILARILVCEGATVPCHTPIGVIAVPGEEVVTLDGTPESGSQPFSGRTPGGRIRISPLAKKVAHAAGIDPRTMIGSGPGGRIVMADVERTTRGEDELVPLTPMRRVIAEQMMRSLRESAQLTLTTTVDAAALVEFRSLLVRQTEQSLSFTDFVVRAVALALRQHPNLNASWFQGSICRHRAINVGVAVDVEGGLFVPVVRNAHQLGLAELHRVISELSEKARAGKLTQDDLAGGTFTVSNLGMYGIDAFTPVLNPPQSAILGLGAIREVPVLRNGTALPGHGMILSLTIDHRVVDGAPGARFLAAVRALLEQPGRLVV